MTRFIGVHFFLLLVILAGLTYPLAQAETVWDYTFYKRFDTASFHLYQPAQMPIDFNNILYPLLNAAIFFETNRRRLENGKTPFVHARPLEESAFMHARDMAIHSFFSHENPHDPGKRTLVQRLALFGVNDGYRAENISEMFGIRYEQGSAVIPPGNGRTEFRDFQTGRTIPNHTYLSFAEALLDGWMKSAGHRANILNEALRFLGCGAYHYRNVEFYGMAQFKAVQNFSSFVPGE